MPAKGHSNFDLLTILGKPLKEVDAIIENKEKYIDRITIPKKDGSPRNVISPGSELKYLQKGIYWRFYCRYRAHPAANGFVNKKGIVTNARPHVKAKSLGKIDISNFFDSITTDHLKNCIFGNKHICRYCKHYPRMLDGLCNPSLYYNKIENFKFKCEEIKAVFIPNYCQETGYESLFNRVIELSTYDGHTAQGFSTSPVIANLVLRGFDIHMSKYCSNLNIQYTRYADDLCFSSKELDSGELKAATLQEAYHQLFAYNFSPNRKKTKYRNRCSKLRVCGVVVNEKLNVDRRQIRLFRNKVCNFTKKYPERATIHKLRRLKGFASFVMSIRKDLGRLYMDKLLNFERQKFKKK